MKVKLIKGLSYKYNNLIATKSKPEIDCSKSEGDYLINTGCFACVERAAVDESYSDEKSLDKMTKNELVAYAAENGIDISGCDKKEGILDVIKKFESNDGFTPLEV
ncbi:MAG: hypothetical protein Q4D26_09700 [Clostridia bacterium]|nr:hypothetical protein [Clostridia bacterium]